MKSGFQAAFGNGEEELDACNRCRAFNGWIDIIQTNLNSIFSAASEVAHPVGGSWELNYLLID